jgi:hypothetical protein
MWCDDDDVVPRQQRAVLSNVNIDAIVRIMTDKAIAFDVRRQRSSRGGIVV